MDTKLAKIDELQSVLSNTDATISRIRQFMQPFTLGTTLQYYNPIKEKGYKLTDVLIWLCTIQAMGLSIYHATRQELSNLIICGEKCVYYRLMENPLINWRGLYRRILLKYYEIVKIKGEEPAKGAVRCYIIDDTLIEKTGKFIEGVTTVFDHVTRKSVLGLKMLVLGYWDGMNFLGVDFSVHHELGKTNKGGLTRKEQKQQHKKVREKDSCTDQRRKELDQSKIDSAINMLKRSERLGLPVDYVLTDSWFTCMELITVVRAMLKGTVHFLGMVAMNRHKFEYKGKSYTTTGLICLLERKTSHYSRKFKCRYIDVVVYYQGVELRLFLIKYGTKGKFRAVLTTNVKLKFVEMMDIYKIRWSIEVFFKECKQYLKLGKYQSTNFDGQIASLTVTMITHTVLTLEKRFSSYQTMGELFRETQKDLLEFTLWERLNVVIIELINFLMDLCEIDIEELMERILNNEQYEKQYSAMLMALKTIKQEKTLKLVV